MFSYGFITLKKSSLKPFNNPQVKEKGFALRLRQGYIFIECTSGCRVISTQESVILPGEKEKSRKSEFTSSRTPLCMKWSIYWSLFYYVCDFSAFFYRHPESRYFSVQQKTTLSAMCLKTTQKSTSALLTKFIMF